MLKARQLAAAHTLPLVLVHHMEAHALVARLGAAQQPQQQAHESPGSSQQQHGQQQQQQQPEEDSPGSDPAPGEGQGVQFPFLCLLISGGHNLLLVVEGVGQYVQLGTTLDDALGE